jgi:hypothetical protein
VNLSPTPVADVHLQALLPFGKPPERMGSIRMKAEVPQPKPHVALQASGIHSCNLLKHSMYRGEKCDSGFGWVGSGRARKRATLRPE